MINNIANEIGHATGRKHFPLLPDREARSAVAREAY